MHVIVDPWNPVRKDFCAKSVYVWIPLQGTYEVINSFQAINCVEIKDMIKDFRMVQCV